MQESKKKSWMEYIRSSITQAYAIAKRILHKLWSFVKKHWKELIMSAILLYGPIYFYGPPVVGYIVGTYFSSSSDLIKGYRIIHTFLCFMLKNTPIFGLILHQMSVNCIQKYFSFPKKERNKQYQLNMEDDKMISKYEKELQQLAEEKQFLSLDEIKSGLKGVSTTVSKVLTKNASTLMSMTTFSQEQLNHDIIKMYIKEYGM